MMKKLALLLLVFVALFSTVAQAKIHLGSTIRSGCQPVEPPADPGDAGK